MSDDNVPPSAEEECVGEYDTGVSCVSFVDIMFLSFPFISRVALQ